MPNYNRSFSTGDSVIAQITKQKSESSRNPRLGVWVNLKVFKSASKDVISVVS
jgi:hypothetical protein